MSVSAEKAIKCKKCGLELKPNWAVCPKCAEPVKLEPEPEPAKPKQCWHCGEELEEWMKVCPVCGKEPQAEAAGATQGMTAEDYLTMIYACDTIEEKMAFLDAGIETFPYDIGLLKERASWLRFADDRGAIRDITEVIRIAPNDVEAYLERSEYYTSMEEYDLALADANKAINIAPSNADCYHRRADVFFYMGNFDAAMEDYDKATSLNPKNASFFQDKGRLFDRLARREVYSSVMSYSVALNWYNLAIYNYTEAIMLDPNSVTYACRGELHMVFLKWQDAIQDFTKVIKLEPDRYDIAKIYVKRGNAKYKMNNTDGAKLDYQEALNLDPSLNKSDKDLFWYQPCFITTAVCESFAKPDNCYELTAFRNFRNNWLAKQPEGKNIIDQYYDVAPGIVAAIDKNPNRNAIYAGIWKDYLSDCLSFIENRQFGKCKDLYMKMVNDLNLKWR